jgi:hypothetical protein
MSLRRRRAWLLASLGVLALIAILGSVGWWRMATALTVEEEQLVGSWDCTIPGFSASQPGVAFEWEFRADRALVHRRKNAVTGEVLSEERGRWEMRAGVLTLRHWVDEPDRFPGVRPAAEDYAVTFSGPNQVSIVCIDLPSHTITGVRRK